MCFGGCCRGGAELLQKGSCGADESELCSASHSTAPGCGAASAKWMGVIPSLDPVRLPGQPRTQVAGLMPGHSSGSATIKPGWPAPLQAPCHVPWTQTSPGCMSGPPQQMGHGQGVQRGFLQMPQCPEQPPGLPGTSHGPSQRVPAHCASAFYTPRVFAQPLPSPGPFRSAPPQLMVTAAKSPKEPGRWGLQGAGLVGP